MVIPRANAGLSYRLGLYGEIWPAGPTDRPEQERAAWKKRDVAAIDGADTRAYDLSWGVLSWAALLNLRRIG